MPVNARELLPGDGLEAHLEEDALIFELDVVLFFLGHFGCAGIDTAPSSENTCPASWLSWNMISA